MLDKIRVVESTEARKLLLGWAAQTKDPKVVRNILEMEDILFRTQKKVEFWQNAAIYLAECHAATAKQEVPNKRVSGTKKARYREICKIAYNILCGSGADIRHKTEDSLKLSLEAAKEACHTASEL